MVVLFEASTIFFLMNKTPGVNFINILRPNFLYKRHFGSFFYVNVTREKLTEVSNLKFKSLNFKWFSTFFVHVHVYITYSELKKSCNVGTPVEKH